MNNVHDDAEMIALLRSMRDEAMRVSFPPGMVYMLFADIPGNWYSTPEFMSVREFVRQFNRHGLMDGACSDTKYLGVAWNNGAFLLSLPTEEE
jgi:hypothetical protein